MALTIGVDLDGVQVDFTGGWVDQYEQWFGVKVDRKKLAGWDAWKDITHFETEDQFWAWTDAVPGFWRKLAPIAGAMGAVYRLINEGGHRLEVVTSRHEKTRAQTSEWVQQHWPIHQFAVQVHHVKKTQKHLVDCQVYIDDNPEVIKSLAHRPCVIVFDQPWNQDVEVGGSVHRVKGWDGVLRFIHLLEHGDDDVAEEPEELVDPKTAKPSPEPADEK